MKTKIMSVSKTGIFIACLLFLFSGNAMAQEKNKAPEGIKATIVATVDLHDASIVSQDAGKFKIGFNLANRDGIQPDVRYGITLIEQKGKDQFVIDQKVYDEVLNLGPKQILHKEIEYQAPKYLSGKYILLLEARNSDGLVFAMLPAGEVTLTGDGQYVNLSQEDCYLTIDGDKNGAKYNLRQGVDVAKEENIIINCEAQNNFSKDISATPYFQTYYRSQFGKMTDKASGTAIKFSQKQKSKVAISLVKAKDPQAYDAEMYLKDASGNQISNSVYLHYVLRGASATIQNIVLDKDSYKAGEVAKLSFNWSGSADSFPGSRGERTDIGTPKVTVSLMSKGSTCIDPYSQQLQDTDAKFN
ncbi:MAG TPA: hypothetical protein VK255_03890, partial [Patescibacteria group bacterium]|nr:hypothetical protein [Patescibacteria group bacterium]